MGQILHGSAKTTEAIRIAIQNSQESLAKLAKKYSINKKTVAKWKKRDFSHDKRMGPVPRSTVLSTEAEAVIVAFRKHTLLPLDDCLFSLQESIPKLTRSSLHRCLQRHGISRLPEMVSSTHKKKRFKKYEIGYIHIDIAEIRTQEGKLNMFVAIDRTSKFTYVELYSKAGKKEASEFLKQLINVLPYKIHTILTDNGVQFTNLKHQRHAFEHIFDRVCRENNIEHRLTKVNHPWTNGQVERMNRTIKEATVSRFFYDSHKVFKEHLFNFLNAYNFAKRLKTLNGLTPYEFIIKSWNSSPHLFIINPNHHNLGLYI